MWPVDRTAMCLNKKYISEKQYKKRLKEVEKTSIIVKIIVAANV